MNNRNSEWMKEFGKLGAHKSSHCPLENKILRACQIPFHVSQCIHQCTRFFAMSTGETVGTLDYKIGCKQLRVRSRCCPVERSESLWSRHEMASFFSWRPAWAATPLAESGNCDRRYTRKSGTENVMSKELWNWNEDNKHGVRIWLWEYLKREYENTNKLSNLYTHGVKRFKTWVWEYWSTYSLYTNCSIRKYPLIKVKFEARKVWADSAVGKENVSRKRYGNSEEGKAFHFLQLPEVCISVRSTP